jgi:AbrB family looped-hinge helix DNA binding protein
MNNMKYMTKMKKSLKEFCASVKVGARGQIVIPLDLRKEYNINPGDTLIVYGKGRCIEIIKSSLVKEALKMVTD